MATLRFHGGSDEVTGSRHLLDLGTRRLMLDCGLFQGHRQDAIEKNRSFRVPPGQVDAVLLSHVHIDHSGGLPLLARNGFTGSVHCTTPTADLLKIMLFDSAHLQEEDARFFNKIHADEGLSIEPLYDSSDVKRILSCVVPHEYGESFEPVPGTRTRFLNAGHVLGSALVDVEFPGRKARHHLLFTGDLGRRESLLMRPPVAPSHVDTLLTESTYGGRHHPPVDQAENTLADLIHAAVARNGRILIPSFALERTQEIVFLIERLRMKGRIPPIHVYVDSPMASEITEIFQKYRDHSSFSDRFHASAARSSNPFGFGTVRYLKTVDESKALNEKPGPKIIIAASGMCEGGRILHHLRNNIEDETTTVILVGFQAQGTLGRRLAERAKKVKIFGLEHELRATVEIFTNLSSHADEGDLTAFIAGLAPRPREIFLVHGDTKERLALKAALAAAGIDRVTLPAFGEDYELD